MALTDDEVFETKEHSMHKLAIIAVSTASLFSLPALAQSNSSSPENSTQAQQDSSSAQASHHNQTSVQQHLADQLKQDGFTDVRVVPDSFLVHAKNKHGDPVVMIINPNSVFSMTEESQNHSGSSSNNSASSK
jgi:uncharacterized protein YdeI (BOF family)